MEVDSLFKGAVVFQLAVAQKLGGTSNGSLVDGSKDQT